MSNLIAWRIMSNSIWNHHHVWSMGEIITEKSET